MEELVELGVSWVWMGLESPQLELRQAERHRHPANSRASCARTASSCSAPPSSAWSTTRPRTSTAEIEHAVAHDTDFHQFMLYTPVPGTPLYAQMDEQGRLLERRPGRHPRPVQVQLRARRHLARRVQEVPRLGLLARLRAQRPQPVPHLPHQLRGLEAVQEPPRPARAGAGAPWNAQLLRHGWRRLLWAMERRLARCKPAVSAQIRATAQGDGAGIRHLIAWPPPAALGPSPLVDQPPGRAPAAGRHVLRAHHVPHPQQLGGRSHGRR